MHLFWGKIVETISGSYHFWSQRCQYLRDHRQDIEITGYDPNLMEQRHLPNDQIHCSLVMTWFS